jgi:hypothetical protein
VVEKLIFDHRWWYRLPDDNNIEIARGEGETDKGLFARIIFWATTHGSDSTARGGIVKE